MNGHLRAHLRFGVSLAALLAGAACSEDAGTGNEAESDPVSLGIFSETPPFLAPDLETFFGTFSGLGGVVSDFLPDTNNRMEGTRSLRITLRSSGTGFGGWFIAWGNSQNYTIDSFVRDMSGGYSSIRFWVMSPVNLEVGFRSGNVPAGSETSKVLLSQLGVTPGSTWKQVCVPLPPLTGARPLADLERTKILFLVAVSQASGNTGGQAVTVWIDDVRWDMRTC